MIFNSSREVENECSSLNSWLSGGQVGEYGKFTRLGAGMLARGAWLTVGGRA